MNRIFSLLLIVTISLINHNTYSQIERINETIDPLEAESHLRFLTSDELKGRNAGTEELIIAGRYIAEQFRRSGVTPLGDSVNDYFQRVPLYKKTPASEGVVTMAEHDFNLKSEMVVISGSNGVVEAPLIFIADLTEYNPEDVKDKIVVTVLKDVRQSLRNPDQRNKLNEAGAKGMIELFGPGLPTRWPLILNYLDRERMSIGEIDPNENTSTGIPQVWVLDTAKVYIDKISKIKKPKATIKIGGIEKQNVSAFNVVGKIEGTDPELKKEHIVMCAHYDHVGIGVPVEGDSIYNGTRDNGIGTTGVINAAKYFGTYPPKRSIILIGLTAEEKGLLGSRYYTDNPKIPLEETVFAFNIDNSGYTDTNVLTLLDTNRTNIDQLVYQAAAEVELGVIGDRLPSQNYYERSDQVSFAVKGVPAVNFKMAMSAFDERITKYYHRPADEFDSVDIDYIHKYWKAYIRSAELLGNWDQTPYWIPGDKFEPAGDELYGKKSQ